MIYVFDKQKIMAYVVSIAIVITLFSVSGVGLVDKEAIETSSSVYRMIPIYNVETEEKKVAFTMNCAWNDEDIEQILDVLEKKDVRITFFLVGDWIDKYPDAAKKIYEKGHEIATHSNTHPHVNSLSYEENIEELELSNIKIEKITGSKTNLYRTPYGEYNNTVITAASDSNYSTIQWSLDTLDYEGLTGKQMWERLQNKLKNGDIILSHNGTEHTADSLEMLLSNIEAKGFEVVKVSELIYTEDYTINNNGTQIKNN